MTSSLPTGDDLHGPSASVAVLCQEYRQSEGGNSVIGVLEGIQVERDAASFQATAVVMVHAGGGLREPLVLEMTVKDPGGYAATDIFNQNVTFERDEVYHQGDATGFINLNALRLRIRDNGPGQAARYHAGHGLLGMRERAAAVGGSLQTGDARGGGFCVEAELPAKVPDVMTGRRADRTHP
jgi:hypothetical protein